MNPAPHTDDFRFSTLLKRWAEGDVNAAEERELFRLAEGDAFRQAALDGFLEHSAADHKAALSRLQNRLSNQNHPDQQEHAAPAKWRIHRLLAAAAATIALLVAVWQFRPERPQAPMAETAEPTFSPSPEKNDPASDTATSEEPIAALYEAEPERKKAEEPNRRPEKAKKKPGGDANSRNLDKLEDAELIQSEERVSDMLPPAKPAPENAIGAHTAKANEPVIRPQRAEQFAPTWWADLQRYLRINARLTPEARNNNITGNVRLRGHLKPDGQMVDIQFEETLGYGLEREALLLMQNFQWPVEQDTFLFIDIRFVR